jgi:hypothetical protein
VPSTLAPRRRRRRFPEQELLNRLRKYEDLLRQNDIEFEPLRKVPIEGESYAAFGSDEDQPELVRAEYASTSPPAQADAVYEAKYLLPKQVYDSI